MVDGKRPRDFTVAERRSRFLAGKSRLLESRPIKEPDTTAWNDVDNPPTAEQYALISPPVREGYSRVVSLKIHEPGTKRFVKSMGRFHHPTESWVGGVDPPGGDSVGGIMVTALAWAHME
jgi:hypothetical protein